MLIKGTIWRQLRLVGNLIDFSKLCCCSGLVAIACPLCHCSCCCCRCCCCGSCLNVVVTLRLHWSCTRALVTRDKLIQIYALEVFC